ncbi:MAG: MFS transporter [Chromatiales bacterium]
MNVKSASGYTTRRARGKPTVSSGRQIGRRALPRVVVLLSVVSMLNDAASEMITPLLPLVVTATLGGGPFIVGVIEGLAETTSSLLKLASGRVADRGWSHRWLVIGGYLLSNIARPLIGLAGSWGWVMTLRFLDRAGKGIRTSPRDALIAGAVSTNARGRAFGFHRAMDHGGAIIGPLLAWPLLAAGVPVEHVFLASAIPGVLVLLTLWFGLPATPPATATTTPWPRWTSLDARLRGLIVAAAALTLSTLPEALMVLWAYRSGVATVWIPLLWAIAHVVKLAFAYAAGALSDRIGRLPVVMAGWCGRVLVLVLIALGASGPLAVWMLFLLYAAALASTEAAERALIGDVAPADQKGTAFGAYHFVCGVLALPSAALFGWLWEGVSLSAAFLLAAVGTAAAAVTLVWVTQHEAEE